MEINFAFDSPAFGGVVHLSPSTTENWDLRLSQNVP